MLGKNTHTLTTEAKGETDPHAPGDGRTDATSWESFLHSRCDPHPWLPAGKAQRTPRILRRQEEGTPVVCRGGGVSILVEDTPIPLPAVSFKGDAWGPWRARHGGRLMPPGSSAGAENRSVPGIAP
ncbi:unnamed protein product [Lepidochelys kempii]